MSPRERANALNPQLNQLNFPGIGTKKNKTDKGRQRPGAAARGYGRKDPARHLQARGRERAGGTGLVRDDQDGGGAAGALPACAAPRALKPASTASLFFFDPCLLLTISERGLHCFKVEEIAIDPAEFRKTLYEEYEG